MDEPTSSMTTEDLVEVMAGAFRDLPDSATVSLGNWIDTPDSLLPTHFNARLALKVGDLRQIANDIAAR